MKRKSSVGSIREDSILLSCSVCVFLKLNYTRYGCTKLKTLIDPRVIRFAGSLLKFNGNPISIGHAGIVTREVASRNAANISASV